MVHIRWPAPIANANALTAETPKAGASSVLNISILAPASFYLLCPIVVLWNKMLHRAGTVTDYRHKTQAIFITIVMCSHTRRQTIHIHHQPIKSNIAGDAKEIARRQPRRELTPHHLQTRGLLIRYHTAALGLSFVLNGIQTKIT